MPCPILYPMHYFCLSYVMYVHMRMHMHVCFADAHRARGIESLPCRVLSYALLLCVLRHVRTHAHAHAGLLCTRTVTALHRYRHSKNPAPRCTGRAGTASACSFGGDQELAPQEWLLDMHSQTVTKSCTYTCACTCTPSVNTYRESKNQHLEVQGGQA